MDPKKYTIQVRPGTDGGRLRITVDGEELTSDEFQFTAPVGDDGPGIAVRTITQVELIPPKQQWEDDRRIANKY